MENPDPRLYRDAEVALLVAEEVGSYRGFLSRGRIAGRLRRLFGGAEWDFRKPYLGRNEAERLRCDLTEMGLEARWEDDVIVVTDPERRWRSVRIPPNRHGLYQVGEFGRAVRPGSGFQREWEEVVALPREGSLSSEVIAAALDTGHALGPAFGRIEEEVDVPILLDALSLAGTDYARERLCILLAHHDGVTKAVGVLPLLRGFLDADDRQLRQSAAYAIGTIAGRAGPARAKAADPDLAAVLRARFSIEEDESVRDDLEAALGAFGEPPPEPRRDHAEQFTRAARRWFDFLKEEYGFEEPTVEDRSFSTTITYQTDRTAVVASADWRDRVVDVFLVELREGGSLSHLTI